MKQRKAQIIKARVSTEMKRRIDNLAHQRGESEAVIVREALSQYLNNCAIPLKSKASHPPKRRHLLSPH
jgi:predicted DNA-binding protein